MADDSPFDLKQFLPYRLNRMADQVSEQLGNRSFYEVVARHIKI